MIVFNLDFSLGSQQVPGCVSPPASPHFHTSHPNLSTAEANIEEAFAFLDSPDSPTDANRLQEDFCRLANNSESLVSDRPPGSILGILEFPEEGWVWWLKLCHSLSHTQPSPTLFLPLCLPL